LLQALNSGHSGTLSTIHANSAEQALRRFTSCVLQSGVDLPYAAIRHGIAECVQLLVHLERRHARRLVTELVRVRGYDPSTDAYDLQPLSSRPIPVAARALDGRTTVPNGLPHADAPPISSQPP
jgi:pilus assembly protein CpaF